MRHMKSGRHLSRTSSHRQAMMRNLAISLFVHGRVETTPEKAKQTRPFAERLITLARRGDFAARRRAIRLLHDPKVVTALFSELGPRYKDRAGGYTRILHMEKRRVGDSARLALFELVEESMSRKGGKKAPDDVEVAAPVAAPAADAADAIKPDADTEPAAFTESAPEMDGVDGAADESTPTESEPPEKPAE